MRARPLRDVGIVVVSMVVLLAFVPALAARLHRQGPAAAGSSTGFQPLGAQPQAFVFSYRGHNQPVQVLVDANPADTVGFAVYAEEQWQALAGGDSNAVPAGRGVADANNPGRLAWQGAAAGPGAYYVQVFRLAAPASFWIAVSGPGAGELARVASETPTPAPTVTATRTATAAPPTDMPTEPPPTHAPPPATLEPDAARPAPLRRPTASPSPTTPPRALVGAGNFQPIGEQGMEFVFQYRGGDLPMQVIVEARPAGAVEFKVFTDLQWTWFGQGDLSVVPIGRGTANPHAAGNLFWQGTSPMAGRYHVQVVRLQRPATFWIAVAGAGAGELIPVSPPAANP